MIFHSVSNYNYHFIIIQLAEEFEGQLECLGENTEKYITFSVPTKKARTWKVIKYKIIIIDSVRCMGSSLSSLTDNLVEGLHKGKCKDCKSSLEYMTVKDSLLTFK